MRAIDADALSAKMYHEAFETDTDFQRWDSGCWIRYKMFETAVENAPTIEPEPPWIPVSERLPEQGRPILFCDVDGDVFHGFYKHSQWNEFLASYPIVNVVAWMPQPKSYKGVKNA